MLNGGANVIKDEFEKMFIDYAKDGIFDFRLRDFVRENMLNSVGSIPCLFRYSRADYYNIRGVETETLFLLPIGTMNDVFEGLSCEIDDSVLERLEKYSECAYIKSFSEENDNLLMWAHYADNYSGMCVEYDFSKLAEGILYHLFPICYSSHRFSKLSLDYSIDDFWTLKNDLENGNPPQDDYAFLKDIMHLFLVKPECWSYEKEWRIVATFPQLSCGADEIGDECHEFYDICQRLSVKDCIKAVYFGPKMKSDVKAHIAQICREKLHGVKVYNMRLSNTEYGMVPELYPEDEHPNKFEEIRKEIASIEGVGEKRLDEIMAVIEKHLGINA